MSKTSVVAPLGSGEQLSRRVLSSLSRRADVAGLCGGAVVAVYLVFVTQGPHSLSTGHDRTSLLIGGVYLAGVGFVNQRARRRLFRPVHDWLASAETPGPSVVRAVTSQPRDQALVLLGDWMVAALLFGLVGTFGYHDSTPRTLRVLAAIVLGGATSAGLSFLLIERALRPVYSLVLAQARSEQSATVSVRGRFLLAWALGSGICLVAIAFAPIGRGPDAHRFAVATVFLAVIGMVSGAVLTVSAARSVAEPLADVRRGMQQIRAGSLEVHIPIDAPGEVGLLQAGLNDMAEGLRERERLRDLFGRHVGDDVARQALERGVTLGGELRTASALFVDLTGSTRLAFSRPPDEVVAILNEFFRTIVDTVATEGGWVNKFEGDAALCVFGAPIDQPDHAARALRSARELHQRLAGLFLEHPGLDAGIGVASGPLIAGNVGSEQRYEYTVIGDPVNEAARLTEVAKSVAERVATSATTIERCGSEATNWREHQTLTLRGRDAHTIVYVPASIAPSRNTPPT